MNRFRLLGSIVAVILAVLTITSAAWAQAPALGLVPATSHAFIYIPSMSKLSQSLISFSQKAGIETQVAPETIADMFSARTGVTEGLDPDGAAVVAFLDPKQFEGRSTLYVLGVKDFDKLLLSLAGQEIEEGMYVLTGVEGARFAYERKGQVLLTNSLRTMQATVEAQKNAFSQLDKESQALLERSDAFVRIDLASVVKARQKEMTLFYRAAAGDIFTQPELSMYGEMLVSMIAGLAEVIDQADALSLGIQLQDDGAQVEAVITFAEGKSVAGFLAGQGPAASGGAFQNLAADVPFATAACLKLSDKSLQDWGHKAVEFFLDYAPRPEPLPETIRTKTLEATDMLLASLNGEFAFMSAPAKEELGTEASVTVMKLKDAEAFEKSIPLLLAAWQELAQQLGIRRDSKLLAATLDIKSKIGAEEYHGVRVDIIEPHMQFGLPPRDLRFRQQLRRIYGPEGMRYRLAIVGDTALVTVGSDLRLFHAAIDNIKAKKAGLAANDNVKAALKHLPEKQNFVALASLPVYLASSIRRSQSADVEGRASRPAVEIGTVEAGATLASISALCDGRKIKFTVYVPHEQIALSYTLLESLLKAQEAAKEAPTEEPLPEEPQPEAEEKEEPEPMEKEVPEGEQELTPPTEE